MDKTLKIKNTLFMIIAPTVLCIIAFVQIFNAYEYNLSPWKGGGFGMFSKVDAPSARYLKVYLITDKDEDAIRTPKSLRDLERKFVTFPTQGLGSQFAKGIIAIVGDALDFDYVRVEAWKYRFDMKSERLEGVKLQEVFLENPSK